MDPHLWLLEFIPVKFTEEDKKTVKVDFDLIFAVKVTVRKGRAHVYQNQKGNNDINTEIIINHLKR